MATSVYSLGVFCTKRQSLFKAIPDFLKASAQNTHSQIYDLQTKYGLRLRLKNSQIMSVDRISSSLDAAPNVPPPTSPSSDSNTVTSPVSPVDSGVFLFSQPYESLYRYRLFPDWSTSFLWYDHSPPQANEDPHVDDEVIESRYPELYPFYCDWNDTYDAAFEAQECHLGSGLKPFPDVLDDVVWEIEGCLLACWLALHENVEQVMYWPKKKEYIIRKETVVDVLNEFLEDSNRKLKTDTICTKT